MSDTNITNEALPVNAESALPSGISHGFDSGYAIAYGVEEAIMIKNFQHFIIANANRGQNFKDGKFWTYDRLEDFPGHFPYWTVKQVRRILTSLIDQGVIIKGEFNDNWKNRTQWFTFRDPESFIKNTKPPKTPLPTDPDLPKRANETCPNEHLTDAQMGNCIKDTPTIKTSTEEINTSLKVPSEPSAAKAAEMDSKINFKPKREKKEYAPKVMEIGDQMIKSMTQIKPDYQPSRNANSLLNEVDFMLRLDNRDPVMVMDVLNWAIGDSFWADKMFKPNPAKYLREKFDQLEMKMKAKPLIFERERKFAPSSNDARALEILKQMNATAI
jgi:hypothetical protein